jgi:predicted ferric reductase
MLIWFLATWIVTVFLTTAAASLYWSVDKTPWRGIFTALSMAFAGIVMMSMYEAFATRIDPETLAKMLYAVCMMQASTQLLFAVRVRRRKHSAMKSA